jgi:glycosyltransferase involved in cell wall biosynthesis
MATIYFHPEAYKTSSKKLMGRNAAGESFLRGFFSYSHNRKNDFIDVIVSDLSHVEYFTAEARKYGRTQEVRTILDKAISDRYTGDPVYYPGPDIAKFCRYRHLGNDTNWSMCGITHTTATMGSMDEILSWITEPVMPWDAVICTSEAVKENVVTMLQAQADQLKDRLGLTRLVVPELPVIPLGIHTEDFSYSPNQRYEARASLGAQDDAIVILYTGRLSFHAKAHPLAMYQALENTAKATNTEIVLVECGWHANDQIKDAYVAASNLACPSVRVITLDGRVARNRDTAWASADIFCSLSDNIQETFGIVPVEAMAAGLPVVVSDWDGYRDTVRNGIDGFCIPTLAPGPGLAGDLAYRHAASIDTYDMYCGHSSSLVALHAQKLGQALIDLVRSPELRRSMGDNGKLRATQNYDWSQIIPRYEELWAEQEKVRLAAITTRGSGSKGKPSSLAMWPARLDPTIGFAKHPTQHLTRTTELMLTEPSAASALAKLARYRELAMVNYASYVFPSDEELQLLFKQAESTLPSACTAEDLLSDIAPQRQPYVLRALAWLCKLGLLQFS